MSTPVCVSLTQSGCTELAQLHEYVAQRCGVLTTEVVQDVGHGVHRPHHNITAFEVRAQEVRLLAEVAVPLTQRSDR